MFKLRTGDPKAGCAPNAGALDVACEKLPPNAETAVVAFPKPPPNVDDPNPVDVCCGELKLAEPPKIEPPEDGFGVAPPNIVPGVGDEAAEIYFTSYNRKNVLICFI